MSKWVVKKCSVSPDKLTAFYGVRKPLAYALYHRKIRNKEEIKNYIDTKNFIFENISNLSGVKKAFGIVKEAIENKSKIYIYGDYDADGVMSTVIMCKGLSGLGANVKYFIPHRVEDGYGLSNKAVKSLIDEGAELIITCDNGISAVEQIKLAKDYGVKVVVLDHHEPAFCESNNERFEVLPEADAIVDAKINNCGYSFTQMCAGGLCYRFIIGLYEFMGKKLENKNELCELGAVATICDVVDLVGENRAIASNGLRLMSEGSSNLGLKTLIEVKEIKEVTSYSVGFVIGPCINASGRLDSAKIAVELFLTNSSVRAMELALTLNEYNEERKKITVECLDRIVNYIENSDLVNDKIIVAYDENTHESVAGIIAGRIREKYDRPAIVLTKAEKGIKGSGRSVEVYNMFEALCEVRNLLTKFGGHTMAAGLSLEKDNIDLFRKSLNDSCAFTLEEMQQSIRMEAVIELSDATIESAEELEVLSPFGKANEKPVFGLKGVTAYSIRFVGAEGKIVSFVIGDGKKRIKAVDFNNYDMWIKWFEDNHYIEENYSQANINMDCCVALEVNEYNGYRNPQFIIKDIRLK